LLEAIDDCVDANNHVRFIDAFVDGFDLAKASFARIKGNRLAVLVVEI
jgi:hypothetical protein